MVRDIDDLADDLTRGIQSAGEGYYDAFLVKRPKTEWSPYIDETAKDISAGIQIGEFDLSKNNFGEEVGGYYRRGLEKTAGRYADLPSVLRNQVSDEKLGLLAYQLNELSYELTSSDFGVDDVREATEAIIEKLLTRHAGKELNTTLDITGGTVTDIAAQLFKNESVASNVDVILQGFEEGVSKGLFALMDEPQMMTPLWEHQREALQQWCDNGGRGYVDMATATGKTVLGLATIALRYGELHPDDQDILSADTVSGSHGREDVLIVAHSDLILEQWRREFDRHLNIPRERTAGAEDIALEWGTVHFRTPQTLVNENRVAYALVLLDEAHHYATGSEWGALLDEFDGSVLAMSGSVDDAGSDSERIKNRLSNSLGGEVKRYTITDAKADGVIPSFDWEVQYAPYDVVGDELSKASARAEQSFSAFQQKRHSGEIVLETDRRLKTYEDLRRFSHTTEGSELKQQNKEFRELVTRLFSRRTKQWNLSPVLDAVVDLVMEQCTTEKVVVLADSNAQVEELESRFDELVPDAVSIHVVSQSQSRGDLRDTIDAFDASENAGVLLGTGDLLGEGVDMQQASVAINMATGGVNPELVQRIGRVLRNPVDTPKHAMFYNVVGAPPTIDAAVPREDGKRIIEQAAGFCGLGGRFDKLPGFSTAAALDKDVFATLLQEGASQIRSLDADGEYEWDSETITREDLEALLEAIEANSDDTDVILGAWEEYAWEHSKAEDLQVDVTGPSADDLQTGSDTNAASRSELILEVQRLAAALDETPTKADMRNDGEYTVTEYEEEFGTWSAGIRAAGFEPHGATQRKYSRQEVIDGLRELGAELGHPPSVNDINEGASFSAGAVYNYFDSIDDARAAAGVARVAPDGLTGGGSTGETSGGSEAGYETLTAYFAGTGAPEPAQEQAEDAVLHGFTRIEELIEVYDAGNLKTPSDRTPARTLESKVEMLIEQMQTTIGEIVGAHLDDGTVEQPSTNPILAHAETVAPVVAESFAVSDGEVKLTMGQAHEPGADSTENVERDGVVANQLAEYYEILRTFDSLLGRIIESDQTTYEPDRDTPMSQWYETINDIVFGDGLGEGPNYGSQQRNRNPMTMSAYRDAFGNGDTVTEYTCIPSAELTGDDKQGLVKQRIINSNEEIYIPVSPKTNTPLPIGIESEKQLEEAKLLLEEFPVKPAAAPPKRQKPPSDGGDSGEGDEPSGGEKTEPPEDDDSPDEPETPPRQAGGLEEAIFWNQAVDAITEYSDEDIELQDSADADSDALDKKIDEWKSQLLDLTRRNTLIAFKPTKTKSLPFDGADPITVAGELEANEDLYIRKRPEDEDNEGQAVSLEAITDINRNELIPTRLADEAEKSLHNIGRNNKQYLRERGVDTLYLSLGMLRWYEAEHSDAADRSPLFLAPVELVEDTQNDADRHNYRLEAKAEELRLNPALRKKLAAERDIRLPADTALSLDEIDAAFESVYQAVRGFDRWTIQSDVVLGIFDFTKFSLYSDLERNRPAIKSNPIVRALNGDMGPIREAEGDIETPSADELDDAVDPVDTYQVLDADSSQQEAIEAAKRGKSFVLQGPPGTGKSQTIANIIAEKLADGERVLFVSEKQAALDVVKNRLEDVGIGRFCLEVHGERANHNDVLGALETELKAGQVKSADNRVQRLRKLRERRDTINAYGDELFYSPDGWDLSAYQAFGIVSEHMDAPRVSVGLDQPVRIGQDALSTGIDELETLARFESEIDTYDTSPWRHTTLSSWGVDTADSMRRSLDQQMATLDEIQQLAAELESTLDIRPESLSDFRRIRALLGHLSARPSISWREAFFDESFAQEGSRLDELAALEQERDELMQALSESYERSFFSSNGAQLNNELAAYGMLKILKPSYRSLKRKVTAHVREGYEPGHDQLLEDTRMLSQVQRIEELRDDYQGVIERLGPLYEGSDTDWETLAGVREWVAELDEFDQRHTAPITNRLLASGLQDISPLRTRTEELLDQYERAASFLDDSMAVEQMSVNGKPLQEAPLSEFAEKLEELERAVPQLQRRVQFEAQLDDVRTTVCGEYVNRFLESAYDAEFLVAAFKKRFYTKWLNAVYEHTDLGSFNSDEMERYLEDFRQLDREQQELAKIEIQHRVTQQRPSLSLEHASSSEQVMVRREAEKQRRHKPLRELFEEAGSFITRLTPCFMMSPLSVAQYLKTGSIDFDAVVFDEASQILPQDAVSSLIRADQAIIAGDTKQLPPTSFFQSDVETTEDVREDLDSILEETASVLPEKHLRWHYRSKTDELIEFSNYHYYNNSLRTFPENDPDVETGVSFEYVEDGVYDRGGSRQNEIEAQRVIDLIEEHAANHSDKSLGVVAFSNAQEQAIRDELEVRRKESSVLDAFVSQDNVLDEFFIKNLEMVQGDERDRMIFSVGYGPAEDGTISTNFGPINKSGGERRLNVAVTRAKEKVTVVCSMQPGDIDLSGSQSTGAQHFKNYLQYAKKGKRALERNDRVTQTLDFDSRFEEAVYTALEAEGHDVVSQVQSSSYSIDLAIKHPDQPGKFVLGIECDGAAYHSSKTARDRDRTRQTVLESLGWTIHRIWSPDWASNRNREIENITDRVDTLITDGVEPRSEEDVRTYEPEAVASSTKFAHPGVRKFDGFELKNSVRYSMSKTRPNKAELNSIQDTIKNNGPIKHDTAMQTCLDVWAQSRAGKKVQRIFNSRLEELKQQKKVYQRGEFLWPKKAELDFSVRVNTDTDSRSVDEIPKEEIAKAMTIILDEGGLMTKDDLILETTRLIGYQRRGPRIQERLSDGVRILEQIGAVRENAEGKYELKSGVNVDEELLRRIYT
ncbi:DUF4011 domain-containing protein [Haloarcula onubensis]|uniref:DUF4011 domain-containing protein n=1 Tax=Haloarcula onubensis TaxID=2950539 RepID=A0ABU2FUM3_9EURY|nr:DUF4011 domain-containing protein [Halomicroarcula sp. S3CR25-11]MDS0284469.1 DUF4011 domain-containing protein [Halomicroarcula sp. S3CR25-11]